MSHLADHARASRILAEALENEYHATREDLVGRSLLLHLSLAHHGAANRMDLEIREEAGRAAQGHACTVDHRTMKGARCGLCGAPKS